MISSNKYNLTPSQHISSKSNPTRASKAMTWLTPSPSLAPRLPLRPSTTKPFTFITPTPTIYTIKTFGKAHLKPWHITSPLLQTTPASKKSPPHHPTIHKWTNNTSLDHNLFNSFWNNFTDDVKSPPPGTFWGRNIRAGTAARLENKDFMDLTGNCCPPARLRKTIAFAFLKATYPQIPILSALHLQEPKSNIYLHFHWVSKQLIGVSFSKWNHQ